MSLWQKLNFFIFSSKEKKVKSVFSNNQYTSYGDLKLTIHEAEYSEIVPVLGFLLLK